MSDIPVAVRRLVETWQDRGFPTQPGIVWPQERWIDEFPAYRLLLSQLPRVLDRSALRVACANASASPEAAEGAFVAVMAWGYGRVGYGPYRVLAILSGNGAAGHLHSVVQTLLAGGAVAAYRRLADPADCRLRGLGPSFGTKFLAFCSSEIERPALILDEMVASWLLRSAGLRFTHGRWHPRSYKAYFDAMHSWADEVGVRAEDIERCIFSDEAASRPGNQWGT